MSVTTHPRSRASSRGRFALPLSALAAVLLLSATSACASSSDPPGRAVPQRSVVRLGNAATVEMYNEAGMGESTILAPSRDVWRVLTDVYERLEIPVTKRTPSMLEMGNLGYKARRVEGRRMSRYVDCGSNLTGQLANSYEVTLSVITRLTDGPEGATVVTTTVDAFGKPRGTSGNEVHCQSRQTLEKRVPELIAEMLGVIVG